MRHAHADFFDAARGTFVQNGVENDHERLGALERKPLLPDVARVQKSFEEL